MEDDEWIKDSKFEISWNLVEKDRERGYKFEIWIRNGRNNLEICVELLKL